MISLNAWWLIDLFLLCYFLLLITLHKSIYAINDLILILIYLRLLFNFYKIDCNVLIHFDLFSQLMGLMRKNIVILWFTLSYIPIEKIYSCSTICFRLYFNQFILFQWVNKFMYVFYFILIYHNFTELLIKWRCFIFCFLIYILIISC